jgi:hypothetical protein
MKNISKQICFIALLAMGLSFAAPVHSGGIVDRVFNGGAKSLAKQAVNLIKQAAALQEKAAGIEGKALALSDRDRRTYQAELERLGFQPPQWLFNDAQALLTGAPPVPEGPGGILGFLARIFGNASSAGNNRSRSGNTTTTAPPAETATPTQSATPPTAPATTPAPASGGNVALPNASILAEYGLSGLPVPAGATVSSWIIGADDKDTSLTIRYTGSPPDGSAIDSWFSNNGWTLSTRDSYETDAYSQYFYRKEGFGTSYYVRSGTDYTFSSTKSSEIVWPSAGILTECGLSGLPMPAGITWIQLWFEKGDEGIALSLGIASESVNDNAITGCFTSNGWILQTTNTIAGEGILRSYKKAGLGANYIWASTGLQITISGN